MCPLKQRGFSVYPGLRENRFRPTLAFFTASSTSRKRTLTTVVAALAAVVASIAIASPAQAVVTRKIIGTGLASCEAGYVCLWTLNDFSGTGYEFYNSESNYSALPSPFNVIDNNSWSFYNNGTSCSGCQDVRFYRGNGSGDSFILCMGESIGTLPPNLNVDPPVATGRGGDGWRDDVSSHVWGGFCP